MRALAVVALLVALACTDPGLLGVRDVETTIVPVSLRPKPPPILIDWSRPKEGLYRVIEVVYRGRDEIETECSYAVIDRAPNAHRSNGKGTWGKIMLVMARGSGASAPVEAWATMGDTLLTRLGLNSINRWRHYGDGLRPHLLIEGVGTRRYDHDFRLVLEWAQPVKPSDFDELYWSYIMQCR